MAYFWFTIAPHSFSAWATCDVSGRRRAVAKRRPPRMTSTAAAMPSSGMAMGREKSFKKARARAGRRSIFAEELPDRALQDLEGRQRVTARREGDVGGNTCVD